MADVRTYDDDYRDYDQLNTDYDGLTPVTPSASGESGFWHTEC